MKNQKGQLDYFTERLQPLGPIKVRSQFGGYSLSIGRAVFAVVASDGLYLRACEASKPYFSERKLSALHLQRFGMPVRLEYYRVDDALWGEPEQLLAISGLCLEGALREKEQLMRSKNIRDLPNIGHQLERLLRQVGISSISKFRRQGARASWLKLWDLNHHLGLNTLFALEGALRGFHSQALPAKVKEELRCWYEAQQQQLSQRTDRLR